MKLYQLVACLDEGVSYSWLFKAESVWHIAAYIVENYQDYPDMFRHLGLDPYSRFEEEKITPDILLNCIGESQIDGDSEYGYEFYEFEESDIQQVDNAHLIPTADYKKYLHPLTGHRNFPYDNFILFQNTDYKIISDIVKIEWDNHYSDKIYEGFDTWLSEGVEIEENTKNVLHQLAKKSEGGHHDWQSFETLAKMVVPLVNLADIDTLNDSKVFYDRLLEGKVNNTFFKGRMDMCIGKGYNEPHHIKFILYHSSFKSTSSTISILAAQMLTAMQNDNLTEMRGACISRGHWDFILLTKDEQNVFHHYQYRGLSSQRPEQVETIYRFISALK